MDDNELKIHTKTPELLLKLASKYNLDNLKKIVNNDNSILFKKDIYICLKNIVEAYERGGNIFENLKQAKNIYNVNIFAIKGKNDYLIKNLPDFDKAIQEMKKYSNYFRLNAYSIVNAFTTIIEAQITGFDLEKFLKKGRKHLKDSIKDGLKTNPNWNKKTLINKRPILIMPIGAAGCGKSTLYRELSNVINISCDNIRYLLFKDFGPSFSSFENCISWWIVNQLTDEYLNKGYNVFYNGVNTDIEYRSPLTMEDPDTLYEGIPYRIKIVYFEPSVKLNAEELSELKNINLWKTPLNDIDINSLSINVAKIINLIKINYKRTLERTEEIAQGKQEQNPYDVVYAVPPGIIKLFVEQSFVKPKGPNVITIPRREIQNEKQMKEFYHRYAEQILSQ
ncbi:MAG: AAA family ATPase [Candidatus Hydrogenedentota bacterium]